ncbi:syncytin-2-like [Xyrichtys novacula]|uniref:Syncytin-2-like n=1 Tax=Xyrichtys novacula TaxID=13765 RepID=A0AAV1GLC3_XYRNO|nr:syncytin-2-like [Xyrichtys novacula]
MLRIETLDYRFGTFANITIRALGDVKEELTALRMMELQDRTVLDQLTAASGGVCALVGTSRCTFIPENDADGGIIQQAIVNLTALRMAVDGDHVNKGDWLSWMTSGPWYHILLKFLTLVASMERETGKMAPVTGSAMARLLLNSFILAIFTAFVIISARISNGCVSAIRIYDRDSLFRIKESMEGLFNTWGKYKQTFPPPFIIDSDSPEYLLLCLEPGKVRR